MGILAAASTAYGTGRTTGVVAVVLLIAALARQFVWLRNDRSTGLKRVLIVGGIGVMVIVNIGRVTGGDDNTWESAQGTQMKAGFIDSCQSSAGTVIDCECAFQRVTSTPPYDTPGGFATLAEPASAAQQSGNPQNVPPVFVTAMQSCPLAGGMSSAG